MKSKKIIALVLTLMLVFTTAASAAVPNNSVIIGSKAFSIDYLMTAAGTTAVNDWLSNPAADLTKMFYQLDGQADVFTGIMTGTAATAAELAALPEITYVKADGTETKYAAGNGNEVGNITVASVSAINGTITVVLSEAPAAAPAAADFVVNQSIAMGTTTPAQSTVAATVAAGADSKTFVLTVPAVAQAAEAQTVIYTVSYKGATAVAAAAFTVEALPQELAVSSVAAVSGTTVKVVFNRAPKAEDAVTYTFAGAAATAVVTGSEAVLTVAQMTDTANGTTPAYEVVVKAGTTTLKTQSVVWDKNEATNITVVSNDLNKQIGNEMALQVKLVDEDGDAMANKEMKLESPAWAGGFEVAKTLTATTDASGIATFKWAPMHDGVEALTVYSADKPVVRRAVNITWAIAATDLVAVDAKDEVSLGDGTAKVYTVTAKNANGSNYAGAFIMDLAATIATGAATVADITAGGAGRTIQVEIWNPTTLVWNNAAASGGRLAETAATRATVTMAAADNGSFKVRVYNVGANRADINKVVPTFYYDNGTAAGLDTQDPRAVGGAINYVAQTPVITLTPLATSNTVATAAGAIGTTTTQLKDYTLKAVDQFGNPYRGLIKIDDVASADGLAGTAPGATVRFDVSYAQNTAFAGAARRFTAGASINLAIGGADADENSTMTLRVTDTAAEKVIPVVFSDIVNASAPADVADIYDANDGAVMASELTFQARVINNIAIAPSTASQTGDIAVGGNRTYTVTFTDQFGDPIVPADLGAMLVKSTDGTAATNSKITTFDFDNSTNVDLENNPVDAASFLTIGAGPLAITTTNNKIQMNVNAGLAADKDVLRVFADANADDSFNQDEVKGEIAVNWVGQALANGSLTGAFAAGALIEGTKGTGVEYVATSAVTATNAMTLTYTLRDQSNGVYTTGPAETRDILWTITNTGTTSGQYWNPTTAAYAVINAGETKSVTTTVAAGASTTTLRVGSTNATTPAELTATAKIAGMDASLQTVKVDYVLPALVLADGTAGVLNGTVVAFSKDGDNNAVVNGANGTTPDGTTVLVRIAGGQLAVVVIATPSVAVESVDSNSFGMTEIIFEGNLSVGDLLAVDAAAAAWAATDSIKLTNK